MAVSLPELAHYAGYFFETRFLGKRKPLVGGINITSYCNLACKHCVYAAPDFPREHLPLGDIMAMEDRYLEAGVRVLFLQGGEPAMWRSDEPSGGAGDGGDGGPDGAIGGRAPSAGGGGRAGRPGDAPAIRDFDDLVEASRKRFFKVACVTNAILPITNTCDLVWVSVDGSPDYHERVRGAGTYGRMVDNIAQSRNPNLHANVTLSKINVADIEANVENIAKRMPRIKAISFNFQIPYPGVEEHALSFEERAEAVGRILALKRRGYPILNTSAALRLMLRPGWNKTHWLIHLGHPSGQVVEGCGARLVDPKICQMCGYGVMAEVQCIYRGSPSSIAGAFKLFRVI